MGKLFRKGGWPMAAKTPDRRVQRTRKLLQDALIALVLEKGYEAVTVQDIIDHANVGRSTCRSPTFSTNSSCS
jgi:hypothetical protein